MIFAWDHLVIGNQNRAVQFFSDAVGLPLILIMFVHWHAAQNFARRGLYAGPRWRIPIYWAACLLGIARRKLDARSADQLRG